MGLGVTEGDRQHNHLIERIRLPIQINRNYGAISYRFRDIITFSKNQRGHVTVTTPLSGTICQP